MDTQLIYDKCMLPLHPFWLISYQGNGSRDIVLFLCFPESERSVFSASAHRISSVQSSFRFLPSLNFVPRCSFLHLSYMSC
ncbi:hypothetical protein ROHU_020767 [Labeo rohita]|uniref:Uncharacterized protein n=1 Tax=Labeo rohita TaxID=84645 RepID=A0A498MWK3_LABRO|nr:hypothetical protein ROHU_020767 [Labeo rohita]